MVNKEKPNCPKVEETRAFTYLFGEIVACSEDPCPFRYELGIDIDPEADHALNPKAEPRYRQCSVKGVIDPKFLEGYKAGQKESNPVTSARIISGTIGVERLSEEEIVDSSVEGVIRDHIAHSE